MRNNLILALLLLVTQIFSIGFAMRPPYLSISAECPYNPDCIFNGWDIPVEITIKNSSNQEIGFPYAYIRRVGPYGRIIDNRSKVIRHLRSGLPDRTLINTYTRMAPNDTLKIKTILWKDEMTGFGQTNVDITVEIGILAAIQVPDSEDNISFRDQVKILILDEHTATERARAENR